MEPSDSGATGMSAERTEQALLFLESYATLCRKHGFIVDVVVDLPTLIDISVPDVIGCTTQQQLEQHLKEIAASFDVLDTQYQEASMNAVLGSALKHWIYR